MMSLHSMNATVVGVCIGLDQSVISENSILVIGSRESKDVVWAFLDL